MFNNILQRTFFNNHISDYIIFILALIIGIVIIKVFRLIVLTRLKKWAKKTDTTIDDFLIHLFEKNFLPLLYFGAFYLSIRTLTLTPILNKIVNVISVALLTIFGIRFLLAIINYALENYLLKKEKDIGREGNIKGILPVVRVIIWSIGILFLLDNIGVNISTVIAGLGIGGVAVALAAQAILGDLFGYFAILFDRPFEIGDFIIIENFSGTVEHIGIKTTRVRSLSGEQLVFSNTDLTNSRVRNYKRMGKRRIAFKLGVTYDTRLEQLKQIPVIIKDIIDKIDDAVFDRAHFSSYGDFSLIYEIVYYVMSNDYNKYMNIQQDINFTIKEEFENRKIEFAYPTQTLFLRNDN